MATRRNVTDSSFSGKTISPAQGGPSYDSIKSDIRPAVPADVIYKLLGFTFAMVFFPIGSYFFTYNYVFRKNAVWAGAFAAVMANVVLIGYILVAVNEDSADQGSSSATGVDVLKRKVEAQAKKSE